MLIYNVTSKIDWSIHEQWVQWMQEVHMPEMLATGLFHHSSLLRLLETDEEEGPTYAAQYHTDNIENYQAYIAIYADTISRNVTHKWGNKYIAFRSLMRTVN